jgi:hypothetical protein
MKNTIKMSLVAALAVAGLSTTASAGGLEEAIKGVTISGKMEAEYDYTKNKTTNVTSDSWDYDIDVTAKIPVNDNITAVVGLEADTDQDVESAVPGGISATSITAAQIAAAANAELKDTDAAVDVSSLYFQYVNGPVTAMVGKQGFAGAPWFDDEKANGLVAVYNAGPVALAAAHFTGTNVTNVNGLGLVDLSDKDIAAAAIIAGDIAGTGINASLWYADVSAVLDSYSVNINGKVADMINFDFRHTDVDLGDLAAGVDSSLTKLVVSADIEGFNVRAGYGTTNDDNVAGVGGLVNLEAGDNDAATTFGLEQLNIADLNDADVYLIGAGATFGATSVSLDYIDGEAGNGANNDFDELLFQVDYKMSKNFTIGAHYSDAELFNTDMVDAAVSLEYKF